MRLKTIQTITVLILLFISLPTIHASDSEKITPYNSVVLQKLDALTGMDYSNEKIGDNIIYVYDYVSSIPYRYDDENKNCINCVVGDGRYGIDYTQYPEETILEGYGDCEDHAILLATMIESLYMRTHGSIPSNLVYVVYGTLDKDNDGKVDGGHGWVIINQKLLPTDVVKKKFSIFGLSIIVEDVIVNDIFIPSEFADEMETTEVTTMLYDTSLLLDKTSEGFTAATIQWIGEEWLELESTWGQPISQYLNKKYPYGGRANPIWVAFNSQRTVYKPTFLPPTPTKPIEIVDITYPLEVETNSDPTISFTIKNNDLGTFWAHMYLEVYDESSKLLYSTDGYVIKWFTRTFSYKQPFSPPSTTNKFTVKMYESDELKDEKSFTIYETDSSSTQTPPTTTPTPITTSPPTTTPTPTTTPQENGKIVVLANSIDLSLAHGFLDDLTKTGYEIIITDAVHFRDYRAEKNIVILGGPDAYNGIGEIVTGLIDPRESDHLRKYITGGVYRKRNRWVMGQKIFIVAGSDRYMTQEAHIKNRIAVLDEILTF